MRVHGWYHLIFATDQQMGAKSWYIDGTSKLCKHPLSQRSTVNAFVRKEDYAKQVSLLFVLMSGQKMSDYCQVFHALLNCLPNETSVQHITSDFDRALWKVLPEFLPNANIKGRVFHWTQAIWRVSKSVD